MYTFLFEGAPRFLASVWILGAMILFCLLILLLTVRHHLRINRYASRMTEREATYSQLVQSVRFGLASTTDISNTIPPEDYPFFERFLQATISSIKDIDVSAERQIAEVCGYMEQLRNRIQTSTKWEKALAIRVLSYFRDSKNLPLFRKIQAEEPFYQSVFAASLGVALCKDPSTFRTIGSRLWDISGRNREALMVVFSVQGYAMSPVVHDILCEEELEDEAKILITKFLGEMGYREATATIAEMLLTETSPHVLASCLYALRYIGDGTVVDKISPFLEHPDFNLRIEALHAVAKSKGSEGLEHLTKGLDDEIWWVRREAALAMTRMGREGIGCLRAAAEGEAGNARAAAQSMLAELRFHRVRKEVF